jgi:hypothetical protein
MQQRGGLCVSKCAWDGALGRPTSNQSAHCPHRRAAAAPRSAAGTGGLPPLASVALPPRSLLVFSGAAYESCLHGIEEAKEERLDESVVNRGSCREASAGRAAAAGSEEGRGDGGGATGGSEAELVGCSCGGGGDGGDGGGSGDSPCGGGSHAPASPSSGPAATPTGAGAPGDPLEGGGAAAGGPGGVLPRTGERLSLTIRRVLKVHKGLRLPGAR